MLCRACAAATVPNTTNWVCPDPQWQGITCDLATGRITSIELNVPLCSPACPLSAELFTAATAITSFSVQGANVAADLSTLDLSAAYSLRRLVLPGNPGVTGPLNNEWPSWMPMLQHLDLNGASIMVRALCDSQLAGGLSERG